MSSPDEMTLGNLHNINRPLYDVTENIIEYNIIYKYHIRYMEKIMYGYNTI